MNSREVYQTAALSQKTPFGKDKLLLAPSQISQNVHKIRVRVNPLDGTIVDCMAAEWPIFGYRNEPEKTEHEKRREEWRRLQKEEQLAEDMTQRLFEKLELEDAEKKEEYRRRAMSRAKRKIHDLAACNEWDYFVTLTLNKEKIDRYDYKAAVQKLNRWMDNRVRRNGLKYIGVPEYHKDKALHFHFLTRGDRYTLKDSGRKQKGRKVYNLLDWTIGHSTAVVLDNNREAVAWYMAKYITKQTDKNMKKALGGTIGGRYYFHGGNLMEPEVHYFDAVYGNFEKVMMLNDGVKTQYIEGAGMDFYYINPELVDLSVYNVKTGEIADFAAIAKNAKLE